MIKRLRVKFVCVVMAIVMVMLGAILGVVIHFAGENIRMQSLGMMRAMAASPLQQIPQGKAGEEGPLPFFAVKINSRGEPVSAGGDLEISGGENIQELVAAVLASGRESGRLERYGLRYLRAASPGGEVILFADTTAEDSALRGMVTGCLVIFVLAMALFLGVTILLSNWVIRPVAQAWDQQRQFVADASHELKTPLSVIMANAELLHNEDSGEPDRGSYAKNILSMSYQMRSLVENMLEVARVDDGAVKMRFAPLDFSQLVRDAVLSVQLLYEERGLGLCSDIPEGIRLSGSEQHLYQVLDVLLDNALKYSTPQGVVSVSLQRGGRSCLLAVSSPGEPIGGEELKQIFKRFYRADKARAMNGSYGLGLSIAESVVNAHKGKIWARSEGGRNIFYVQLPALP